MNAKITVISIALTAVMAQGAVTAFRAAKPAEKENIPFRVTDRKDSRAGNMKLQSREKAARTALRTAKAKEVPFSEDFTTSDNLDDWFIQDVNGDGSSWEYKESFGLLQCYYSADGSANDDWVLTPAINLGKDDVYTLSFSYGSQGSRYTPEQLTVTMGTSEYGTRHTTVLYQDLDIQNFWNGDMKTVTVTLPVEEDGAYYFGFHCTTPAGNYALYLDNISVEQNGTQAAPQAVTDLTVTPGEKGAKEAEVSFTAPTESADGEALSSIDRIDVLRDADTQPVKSFENPQPGEALSFTDKDLTAGSHTWQVTPYLNGEAGGKSEVSAYIGVDKPLKLENVTAVENQDGSITVSWDAATGENGGYTGSDVVFYTVTRTDSGGDTKVAPVVRETSFTDNSVDKETQDQVYYSVTATTIQGTSEAATSNALLAGKGYPIPFKENFAYGTLSKSPWTMEYVSYDYLPPRWSLVAQGTSPLCPTIDGDDGMLAFSTLYGGLNLTQGGQTRLATPAVDLSATKDPYLTFWLFHYDTTQTETSYDEDKGEYVTTSYTYDDRVKVQVSVDNGDYVDVADSEIALAKNNSGWTKYKIPLRDFKGAKKASVGLLGISGGGGNIHIDKLMISDEFDHDLEVTDILGPQSVLPGETAEYLVTVVNNGKSSTKNYTVGLWLDDRQVAELQNPGAAIFADGGEKLFRFSFTPGTLDSGDTHRLYARVNYAEDECEGNDCSDEIALEIPAPSLPAVELIEGEQQGADVAIRWEAPDMESFKPVRRDDMENLTTFAISDISDYTLVDNDKSTTYGVDGATYTNAGAAMAWQVFDASKAGLDLEEGFNRRWYAHSGRQYLISWGAKDSGVSNNDWIISPELEGDEQIVTMYLKSVSMAYEERFRVLYSTKSTSADDFTKIAEAYYTPNGKWRKLSMRLPYGTKYFAVQSISNDAFGIMLDDISFTPAKGVDFNPQIKGYNLYRDGEKLNQSPLTEMSYTDAAVSGIHDYVVTAVYALGESAPSPVFTAGTSRIEKATSGKIMARVIRAAWRWRFPRERAGYRYIPPTADC